MNTAKNLPRILLFGKVGKKKMGKLYGIHPGVKGVLDGT